jgi:hypothetical protein
MPVGDMSMQTTGSTPARHARNPAVNGRAVVDLDAIAHNVSVLLTHAGPAAMMAVVKADAYGHGLVECSRAAIAAGAQEDAKGGKGNGKGKNNAKETGGGGGANRWKNAIRGN